MKRATDSQASLPLKRRSSSVFSISSIVEADDDQDDPNNRLKSEASPRRLSCPNPNGEKALVAPPEAVLHLPVTADNSTCTDADGLCFDENSIPGDASLTAKKSYVQSLPAADSQASKTLGLEEITLEESEGDLRVGIVAESGSKHADRQNRFHKERPQRVTSIIEALEKSEGDLFQRCCILDDAASDTAKSFLDNDEDYLRVHLPGYMQRLNNLSNCKCCDKLDREAQQYNSIYLTQDSFTEAKKAAASLCTLVADVVKGDLDNGFAVIRPPGHHAEPGLAAGFCLINNVAVAAAYARAKLDIKKVLIVDWDIHHGNGTQSIFINDPNVLYFSVHRWQGGNFYPFLQNGGPKNVGLGEGHGFNVNVGWSRKGMSDDEYFAVWERVLMPIAREFEPNLVLVSAGFDGAEGDLGECNVTPAAFGHMTRSLMSLASGRVVCTLEGGYVRSILGNCVEKVVTALLDRTSPNVYTAEEDEAERERDGADVLDFIDPAAAKDIRSTIAAHQSYWKCFRN